MESPRTNIACDLATSAAQSLILKSNTTDSETCGQEKGTVHCHHVGWVGGE